MSVPTGVGRRMDKPRYRSVFISDIHLGAVGAKTELVREFMEGLECEKLYLVGDVIDGWVGRKDRKWTADHADVIRVILEVANTGADVMWTPGNHDDFMRRVHGVQLGSIQIEHSFVHELVDGRQFLVVHGDLFDKTCTKYRPIAFIGAWMYEAVAQVNAKVNRKQDEKGRKQVDFTSALKRGVKKFIGKSTNYEGSIIEFAKESGFDGVVCGHVHRPKIEVLDDGFTYVNSGDWVENCTAVVEHMDGRLELLSMKPVVGEELKAGKAWKNPLRGLVTSQGKGD